MAQMVQAGLRFLRHGKSCYVAQLRLLHEKLEIHSDDGDVVLLSPEALRREVVDGDIQMLVPTGNGAYRPVSNNWRERESNCAQNRRNKRVLILKFVADRVDEGLRLGDIFPSLKSSCEKEKLGSPPCERTLRDWRKLGRGHESMLSPAWDRCGNRFQGPDECLLQAIKEVVDAAILGNDTFTMTAAWRLIEARFDKIWREQKGTEPQPRHSIKKLKNFVRAMPWAEVMRLRLDGRTARSITTTAVHLHNSGIYWECVEMDATLLDILICDAQGNEIGRPVLYVAIDTATGYIVGLHLTIQKPSVLPFVECLRFMYFPKPDGFDEKYGIKKRIEVFGKPVLLRVDNGSEFIGKAAIEVVRQLYGDSARCRPYTPQEKPHVERFNGTLKAYVLTLNGATISSVTGKKRAPKKGEKLFTLEQLRVKIYRFVYDDFAYRANDLRSMKCGKAVAPADIWTEMKSTFTEPVPVSHVEFERSLCFKRKTCRLANDGIAFDGWQYHSDELARLYATIGPGKFEILYSDLDAQSIYVEPPGGGELVVAFEKTMEGNSVDRATAKLIKKHYQAQKKELNRRTFPHALAELRERQQTAKSSRERSKQARIDGVLQLAEERARNTMPKQKVASPDKVIQHHIAGPADERIHVPTGRKMGEKR